MSCFPTEHLFSSSERSMYKYTKTFWSTPFALALPPHRNTKTPFVCLVSQLVTAGVCATQPLLWPHASSHDQGSPQLYLQELHSRIAAVRSVIIMPRFFDDYSNTYLTHDSAAGRKQQRRGWKFRENFKVVDRNNIYPLSEQELSTPNAR